eukprot:15298030-Alexandrium_andersonii.AAC.1
MWKRLRPPARPRGRNVLVPCSKSAEVGDPAVPAPRAGGAALRAAPPATRDATEGIADFADSERGTR